MDWPLDLILDLWRPVLDPCFVFRTTIWNSPAIRSIKALPQQQFSHKLQWCHHRWLPPHLPEKTCSRNWIQTPTSSCKTINLFKRSCCLAEFWLRKLDPWQIRHFPELKTLRVTLKRFNMDYLASWTEINWHENRLVFHRKWSSQKQKLKKTLNEGGYLFTHSWIQI